MNRNMMMSGAAMQHEGTLKGHSDRVLYLAWHPDGKILASCSADETIRIWYKEDSIFVEKHCLTELNMVIYSLCWSPCGRYLAAGGLNRIYFWDKACEKFERRTVLGGQEWEIMCLVWSPMGRFLASSCHVSVWVWDIEPGEKDSECILKLDDTTVIWKKIAWHPHREILAVTVDNDIHLYIRHPIDRDWIRYYDLKSHKDLVHSISYNRNGTQLVSCGNDHTIRVWKRYLPEDAAQLIPWTVEIYCDWKCVSKIRATDEMSRLYDVSWCPLSDCMACGGEDRDVKVYKEKITSREGKIRYYKIMDGPSHKSYVNCVKWNPVVKGLLASCGDDGEISIWFVPTDTKLDILGAQMRAEAAAKLKQSK